MPSPTDETMPADGMRWYCLRSQPKHEHIAAAHLRQEAGIEVFCPRVRLQRPTRRGVVWFTEALFANYLFARFDLQAMHAMVRYARGVAGIVKFGTRHAEVPEAALAALRRVMADGELITVERRIAEGDLVKIISGPLCGEQGVVKHLLPARERVKILMEMLGGAQEIEVGLSTIFTTHKSPLAIQD